MPMVKTYNGETFICHRCDSLSAADCPVCHAAMLDPYDLKVMESDRGIWYARRCEAIRWLWSPAGSAFRWAIDIITLVSMIGLGMLACIAVGTALGRLLIRFF